MEFWLRLLQLIVKIIFTIITSILNLIWRPKKSNIPPITNRLLTLSAILLRKELQEKKITSLEIIEAYIKRIEEVNPHINAVVEDRFAEARKSAKSVDELISKCKTTQQIEQLFIKYPMLGLPFTVKEACKLGGMSFKVGSLRRIKERANENGKAVDNIIAAGAIPLLVSANPEYCFSIETNTYTNGKCLNPYDSRRTCGGSSGGEGALNGAGATLFGIGSDIAGSIRVPALFNGVFGHKATAELVSVKGHFPDSDDADFAKYLQIGPLTRFASDLFLIMHVMAGENAGQLNLKETTDTKDIKIYYSTGFKGLNGWLHQSVAYETTFFLNKAVQHFAKLGLKTQEAHIQGFRDSTEITLSAIARLKNFPYIIDSNNENKVRENLWEILKSLVGKSEYTIFGLNFEIMRRANSFMSTKSLAKYAEKAEELKTEILDLIGYDGVLFFPTFHVSAIHHNTSSLALWGIDYTGIFNVLGLPATHVPIGLNPYGLPFGFQVVAAPYRDRLCIQMATEIDAAFGGWTPPTPHKLQQ